MRVLSLFDGMACGMLAFITAGIPVEQYTAYEVDTYAIQTARHNFPMIDERGDVFAADFREHEGVDWLIGGSPCTYWSVAQAPDKRETTSSGMGWDLFCQYTRALREAKPRFFLYENNKSMSAAIRAAITEAFGFPPVAINSALVSAQNRQRLYWVGIRDGDSYRPANIPQPDDRGVQLADILDEAADLPFCCAPGGKAYCLTSSYYKGDSIYHMLRRRARTQVAMPIDDPRTDAAKVEPLEVEGGAVQIKGQLYPVELPAGRYLVRPFSVEECKRLQTVPAWYSFPCTRTHALQQLGNGWTVEIIAHLLLQAAGTEADTRAWLC